MKVGILKTDGGPHSAEDWAMATAGMLLPMDNLSGGKLLQAQRLQIAVAEALVPHHATVQNAEREHLLANGANHYDVALGAGQDVDAAMTAVQAAGAGTPWEEHLKDPKVVAAMREVIHNHFMTAQHIERSWHKDRAAAAPAA